MKSIWLALSLALITLPGAALADDPTAAPAPPQPLTTEQKQALSSTFRTFTQKQMQLHQQLRSQVLGALSPEHRTAVGNIIGSLAISENPDPTAAIKQIDGLITQSEEQNIHSALNSFTTQSRALHEQMRTELQRDLPPGAFAGTHQHMVNEIRARHVPMEGASSAGALLLMVLAHPMPMDRGAAMAPGNPPPPR